MRSGTFSSERQGMQRAGKFLVSLLVAGFFISAVIWFVFVSGFWTVNQLDIQGLQSLDRGEVEKAIYTQMEEGTWKPWDKRNIFYINEEKLAEQIKSALFLESVAVDKSYPHILRLIIKERQRSVVIASKDQLLNVDFNGVVTGEITDPMRQQMKNRLAAKALADPSQEPLIIMDLAELVNPGYELAHGSRIRSWLDAYGLLNASGLKSRYMRLADPAAKALYVKSEPGWDIIFDLDSDLGPQIESYQKFVQSKPRDLKINEYVDARIVGRVYVR